MEITSFSIITLNYCRDITVFILKNLLSVVSNPCANGEPASGRDGQYLVCSSSGTNVCPKGYWCHVGADISGSLCCPGSKQTQN